MTDDQHGEGTPQAPGRWDPLPQGDYDDGATAFVKLPEGGIDALLASADSPLAAPGHGYVPPQITVAPASGAGTDPAATGTWSMPAEGVQWPAPETGSVGDDRFTYHPGATGQWTFGDANAPAQEAAPAPGHEVTGQWSIPVANGDLPDESGEYTTSALVEQWGATPPATLPGGAPAPWAAQQEPGRTWGGQQVAEPGGPYADPFPAQAPEAASEAPEGVHGPESPESPETAVEAPVGAQGEPEQGAGPDDAVEAVSEASGTAAEATAAPEAEAGPEAAPDTAGDPAADDVPAEAADAAAGADDAPDAQDAAAELPPPPGEEHPLASYVLRVNGADRPVTDAWIGESLLYVLRERLGLAGAKDGCSQGECGACNVQVDGRLVASCLVPAATAAGSEVRTVEGLAADGQPSDVQRALARCGAVQCGFCVPGMAMTVHDLLEGNPAPTELETRQALCGNLCRCSGYRGVLNAVQEVVAEREAHRGAESGERDGDEARIPHQAGPGAGGVNPSAFEAGLPPGTPHPHDLPHDQAYGHGHDQGHGQGQDGGQA
ncbi:aerobic-type carbon monoxide dehydrogenase small subunit (CoxS/CutS family) [Streptomyces sp. SAI-170]|uniref:(2Fe-2S)-binding protein n=1 Tax=Streptomyces sp. SAI-170 TaxID=3377729 RepID=UPI003C7D8D13